MRKIASAATWGMATWAVIGGGGAAFALDTLPNEAQLRTRVEDCAEELGPTADDQLIAKVSGPCGRYAMKFYVPPHEEPEAYDLARSKDNDARLYRLSSKQTFLQEAEADIEQELKNNYTDVVGIGWLGFLSGCLVAYRILREREPQEVRN